MTQQICKSGDDCDRPALEGRNFCQEHQEQLDRIRAEISGWKNGHASVKSTH